MAMPQDHKTTSVPRTRKLTNDLATARASAMEPRPRRNDESIGTVTELKGKGPTSTLARLMMWLSPAYPVGSYSYSHGLEWVVEAGMVRDAATLGGWIEDLLLHGAGRSDAILL